MEQDKDLVDNTSSTIPEVDKAIIETDINQPHIVDEVEEDKEKENIKILKDIKILNISIEEDKKEAKRTKPPLKKEVKSKKSKTTKLGKSSLTSTDTEPVPEDQGSSNTLEADNTDKNIVQETSNPVVQDINSSDAMEIKEEANPQEQVSIEIFSSSNE